ncbi:cadherin-related family member 4-like [Lissotriton helveticus]
MCRFLLLLCLTMLLVQPVLAQVLVGLPGTVRVAENSGPGTEVVNFSLENCGIANPTVTINGVTPACTYFNPPAVNNAAVINTFAVQITLSSTTALDFELVNQYQLNIIANCGTGVIIQGLLTVQVTDVNEPPQCEEKFTSTVGETVQVLENVSPLIPIYNVVIQGPVSGILTYTITQPNLATFSITNLGQVMPPSTGFNYNTRNNFKLSITVTDGNGRSCSGTLNVVVLPVYNNVIKFTPITAAAAIAENKGPLYKVTTVSASGNNVLYEMITLTSFFSVAKETGVVSTTSNLDLEQNPELANTILTIKAYDKYNHSNSATITVTVTVTDVNKLPPTCTPAVFVKEVPETTPTGTTLVGFTCIDPDFSATTLTYKIVPNSSSMYNFKMSGSSLQVNSTLTYDSAEIASLNFQYSAILEVTDAGTPPLTTKIPIFVTVTPVNQYPPVCGTLRSFTVNEDAPFDTVIGSVNATDKDYKFNNVQYMISGGDSNNPPLFYINPRSGEIHLLSSLDFEKRTTYNLVVQVVDLNNDILPDPKAQKTATCPITIQVQDINDNPPICNPPFYDVTIYSTLSIQAPILTLQCDDIDLNSVLSYSVVGGNINNRFNLAGAEIFHSTFSYIPGGVYDPLTFELLIKVTDSPAPQFSTTATVIIHVVPWTTTVPTTTLKTTTIKNLPRIVNGTVTYWTPDPWFVAVLTITGVLLLLGLSLLAWQIISRTALCHRAPQEAAEPLLQNRSNIEGEKDNPVTKTQEPQNKDRKDITPLSPLSLQFDGRAQDRVTGRDYIFNSQTGERRWV